MLDLSREFSKLEGRGRIGEISPDDTNSPDNIYQPEDGLSEVVQDLREESIIIFDVRLLIAVILTRLSD